MSCVLVDTNVLLVASGFASQMSTNCKDTCFDRLEKAKANERIVVDVGYVILKEYGNALEKERAELRKRNPGNPRIANQPTPADAFLKHILQNFKNNKKVEPVVITPTDPNYEDFEEFPKDAELAKMVDPADKKFITAAYVHPKKPPIVESADSKWLGWETALAAHGIKLEVLCRAELQAIRDTKLSK